jgi:hypothetical protein
MLRRLLTQRAAPAGLVYDRHGKLTAGDRVEPWELDDAVQCSRREMFCRDTETRRRLGLSLPSSDDY